MRERAPGTASIDLVGSSAAIVDVQQAVRHVTCAIGHEFADLRKSIRSVHTGKIKNIGSA